MDMMAAARRREADVLLVGLAVFYFLLEWVPGVVGDYGFFIDEFYFIACSERLASGYVDHPPLSILVLRFIRAIIGDSLPALRILPALAGAATLLVTGWIARRLGANTYGQVLAAGAMAAASIYQVIFSFYSMNALSVLLWAVCFLILVEIEQRNEPRLWLVLGTMAGLGLENKHTFAVFGFGLTAGLLVTPARRHLTTRWPWLGFGIALLILAPNVLWQIAHDGPSLEFYRNASLYKNVPTPSIEVLQQQILSMNPASLPVWLAGLVFLLVTERGRAYRHLGWLYITLLLLMLLGQQSRPDRIAASYTILFAAGGVLLGDIVQREGYRWLRLGLPVALALIGVALAPLVLPILPPQATARYASVAGMVPQIERGEGKRSPLPQWLADRLEWHELYRIVAEAVDSLDPVMRDKAIILTSSYGTAAALERLGRSDGLPSVYSSHNNYVLWGPPADPVELAIVVGFRQEGSDPPQPHSTLRRLFDEIELARVYNCDRCPSWRDDTPIWLASRQRAPFREVWSELKSFH